jgi:hypothetical protein
VINKGEGSSKTPARYTLRGFGGVVDEGPLHHIEVDH